MRKSFFSTLCLLLIPFLLTLKWSTTATASGHHLNLPPSTKDSQKDSKVKQLCEGILEENDLWITPESAFIGTMNERTFNRIIDRVEAIYGPIIASKGSKLVVERDWTDGTVNAYATQSGNLMKVHMFGGMARHPAMTEDAFASVICHEIGHHLGGAPRKVFSWGVHWASNEGQSDYFASSKCMRKYFAKSNNQSVVARMKIDPSVKSQCRRIFGSGENSAICQRSSMAGLALAQLFQEARRETTEPLFTTPDPSIVDTTYHAHPGTQCRLDTYFQASLCVVSDKIENDPDSPLKGTCNRQEGYRFGTRPLCWYHP